MYCHLHCSNYPGSTEKVSNNNDSDPRYTYVMDMDFCAGAILPRRVKHVPGKMERLSLSSCHISSKQRQPNSISSTSPSSSSSLPPSRKKRVIVVLQLLLHNNNADGYEVMVLERGRCSGAI